jgi:hypothetical protein
MEATGVYWEPVWHLLEGHFELVLANAQHIKNVPGRKTDVNDAAWIADLLAHGLIRSSFVPPAPIQQFLRLRACRGAKKAILAVAASMLTAMWHMLKDGVEYRDLGADHFSRRNRMRQIQRLLRRLGDLGCEIQVTTQAA